MQQTGQSITKPRNPKTEAAHKHDVLWQISVPFLIAALVIIALAVIASLGSTMQLRVRADVAAIWLILPMLIFLFVFLVINAGIVYALIRLIGALPGLMYQVQIAFEKIAFYSHKFSNGVSAPLIRVKSFSALLSRLFGRRRRIR